ncbi:MAG TPA: DUF2079 domain-containing protein [Patescibacteria group bacterium]|nr:DUF2079 domain-containing protein [Patescibacteria group bacterium]
MGLTALALAAACFWKYAIFGYNAIDLAYFNQVFWNTVRGRFFAQSIHPHLSLGDHAELAILLLSPLYAMWQDPRMLLLLQAVALVLPAYAIWRIASLRFAKAEGGRLKSFALAPLVVAIAYLLNPAVQNIALFEFHILPFAVAPLLMAVLAYEEGRKGRFLAWTTLALLVREDVALAVVMISALAWIERKPLWWRIAPALLAAAWFAAAMRLIAHFSPDGGYKYRIYYAWLGADPGAMLANAVAHPLAIIAHVATLPNLEMALGFLMPVLFLPLLAPARLILAIGPLLQIVLGAPGGGELIIDTHYATLFLPALMLAAIEGVAILPAAAAKATKLLSRDEARRFTFVLLLLAAAYGTVTLGPLPSVLGRAVFDASAASRAAAARTMIAAIPKDASVAAGYALLPALSSRERLTSLHYVFLGVTQFAEKTYAPPDDIDYVALDADDLLTYRAQFLATAWAAPHYAGGSGRVQDILGANVMQRGPFALYARGSTPIAGATGYAGDEDGYVMVSPYLMQAGARYVTDPLARSAAVVVSARWQQSTVGPNELTVHAVMAFPDGRRIEAWQPLAAPPPFSNKIPEGYETTFRLPVPGKLPAGATVTLSLEDEKASYELDGIRSAARVVTSEETLDIGLVNVR